MITLETLKKMSVGIGRVVIQLDEFSERKIGHIIIPTKTFNAKKPCTGRVVNKGEMVSDEIKIGDRVLFNKYIGDNPEWCEELGKVDGRDYIVLDDSVIYAICEDDKEVQ